MWGFFLGLLLLGSAAGGCVSYEFETGVQSWVIGTPSNGYSTSSLHPTSGSSSLALSFSKVQGTDNAIFLVEGTWDLSGSTFVKFDLWKNGEPVRVAVSLSTGSSWTWQQSSFSSLTDGSNQVTIPISSSWVSGLNEVHRIAILLDSSTAVSGTAYLDSLSICSSSPTPAPTGSSSPPTSSTTASTLPLPANVSSCDFVRRSGSQLYLGDCEWRFFGTNCYYLIYKGQAATNSLLDAALSMGISVIRTWAFIDVGGISGVKDGIFFQGWSAGTSAPYYNDGSSGLEQLDYVITAAKQRGLKVLLALTNNWQEFGGMDQYDAWYGQSQHDAFYTNSAIKTAYKNYVSHLVNRVNTISGVRYRDEPAIFAWELTNEARCSGGFGNSGSCDGMTIAQWADEMSTYLRSIDANHLIAMGNEGFFAGKGSDWTYNGAEGDAAAIAVVPNIDVLTLHLYINHWGKDVSWGSQFIQDHISLAANVSKPLLLEEFGISGSSRDSTYQLWLDALYTADVAGSLFWMLAADVQGSPYPDYDGFTVYAGSSTAVIFGAHANRTKALNSCQAGLCVATSTPSTTSSPTSSPKTDGTGQTPSSPTSPATGTGTATSLASPPTASAPPTSSPTASAPPTSSPTASAPPTTATSPSGGPGTSPQPTAANSNAAGSPNPTLSASSKRHIF